LAVADKKERPIDTPRKLAAYANRLIQEIAGSLSRDGSRAVYRPRTGPGNTIEVMNDAGCVMFHIIQGWRGKPKPTDIARTKAELERAIRSDFEWTP
jgi:hypothetical protein